MRRRVQIPPPSLGSTPLSAAAHRFLAARSDTSLVRGARRLAEACVRLLHSENVDPRTNGEFLVLRRLVPFLDTVIDVGANHGLWSRHVLTLRPDARVVCSEIVSETREALRRSVPQATVLDFGLSDHAGDVPLKHYPDDDRLSSMFDYPHSYRAEWLTEHVETGDSVVEAEKLTRVDMLKIDAEGADLAVLRGFGGALESGTIRVVQFEYGYACVVARTFLLDFYELLEGYGYRLGKVHRDGVEFVPYRLELENFFGPNYLAVHSSAPEIVELLRAGR